MNNRELKTERLQIPVTPQDRDIIERIAAKEDMSTAAWIRRLLRKEIYSGL